MPCAECKKKNNLSSFLELKKFSDENCLTLFLLQDIRHAVPGFEALPQAEHGQSQGEKPAHNRHFCPEASYNPDK